MTLLKKYRNSLLKQLQDEPEQTFYFISTIGSTPLSTIKQYIENQKNV